MRIYLRPVTLDDGKLIVKWRNTPSVISHCFDKRTITEQSNAQFYHDYIESGKYKQFIVERIDEEYGVSSYPIATVYLKDIDEVNNRCELCIFTSDDQEWNTESKSIAIKLLLNKAFNEFSIHKVYSYVFTKNEDEVDLLKKAGMSLEAILANEAIDSSGKYVDVVRMCIFDNQTN